MRQLRKNKCKTGKVFQTFCKHITILAHPILGNENEKQEKIPSHCQDGNVQGVPLESTTPPRMRYKTVDFNFFLKKIIFVFKIFD